MKADHLQMQVWKSTSCFLSARTVTETPPTLTGASSNLNEELKFNELLFRIPTSYVRQQVDNCLTFGSADIINLVFKSKIWEFEIVGAWSMSMCSSFCMDSHHRRTLYNQLCQRGLDPRPFVLNQIQNLVVCRVESFHADHQSLGQKNQSFAALWLLGRD